MREPAGDLDVADVNASAWNRASCGMLDLPSEIELSEVDVLAIIAAESIVISEAARWGWRP